MIIVGIKFNGEHIPFEEWVYEGIKNGNVKDPMLLNLFNSCSRFYYYW